jgi:hypothetical protein
MICGAGGLVQNILHVEWQLQGTVEHELFCLLFFQLSMPYVAQIHHLNIFKLETKYLLLQSLYIDTILRKWHISVEMKGEKLN